MEETKKAETHLTSAAAFVEGGVQEACDDACSICLENFRESDPSTACIVDINDLFIWLFIWVLCLSFSVNLNFVLIMTNLNPILINIWKLC